MDDARTFQRTARVVSLLARRDRAQLDRHNALITTLKTERARLAAERKTAEDMRARLVKEQQALGHAIAAQGARVKEIEERRDLNEQLAAELIAAQDRLSASVTAADADTRAAGHGAADGGTLRLAADRRDPDAVRPSAEQPVRDGNRAERD